MADDHSPLSSSFGTPWRPLAVPTSCQRSRLSLWAEMLIKDSGWMRCLFNTRSLVAPGVYRSSHPLPYQLRAAARDGIRTVINLRGMATDHGSYVLEQESCERHGLRLLQYRLPSRDLPRPEQVLGFAQLMREIEYPVLLHCKAGADRVGLASALTLMLREQQPPEVAMRELSLRHLHFSRAKTGMLDFFVQCYAEHRARHGTALLDWVRQHYDVASLRKQFRSRRWARIVTDRVLQRE